MQNRTRGRVLWRNSSLSQATVDLEDIWTGSIKKEERGKAEERSTRRWNREWSLGGASSIVPVTEWGPLRYWPSFPGDVETAVTDPWAGLTFTVTSCEIECMNWRES